MKPNALLALLALSLSSLPALAAPDFASYAGVYTDQQNDGDLHQCAARLSVKGDQAVIEVRVGRSIGTFSVPLKEMNAGLAMHFAPAPAASTDPMAIPPEDASQSVTFEKGNVIKHVPGTMGVLMAIAHVSRNAAQSLDDKLKGSDLSLSFAADDDVEDGMLVTKKGDLTDVNLALRGAGFSCGSMVKEGSKPTPVPQQDQPQPDQP